MKNLNELLSNIRFLGLNNLADNIENGEKINVQQAKQDIAKKYRELSIRFHPDKPSGDIEKFKDISEKYNNLINSINNKEFSQLIREEKYGNLKEDDYTQMARTAIETNNLKNLKKLPAFNTNKMDIMSTTLLMIAVKKGNIHIIEELLKRHSNVHTKDAEKNTALHFATENGNDAAIELLLKYGANPDAENIRGLTPKTLLIGNNNPNLHQALIGTNPNINLISDYNSSIVTSSLAAKGINYENSGYTIANEDENKLLKKVCLIHTSYNIFDNKTLDTKNCYREAGKNQASEYQKLNLKPSVQFGLQHLCGTGLQEKYIDRSYITAWKPTKLEKMTFGNPDKYAYIEPIINFSDEILLGSFEECFTSSKHVYSDSSIAVIPDADESKFKEKNPNFKGQIFFYNGSLTKGISDALKMFDYFEIDHDTSSIKGSNKLFYRVEEVFNNLIKTTTTYHESPLSEVELMMKQFEFDGSKLENITIARPLPIDFALKLYHEITNEIDYFYNSVITEKSELIQEQYNQWANELKQWISVYLHKLKEYVNDDRDKKFQRIIFNFNDSNKTTHTPDFTDDEKNKSNKFIVNEKYNNYWKSLESQREKRKNMEAYECKQTALSEKIYSDSSNIVEDDDDDSKARVINNHESYSEFNFQEKHIPGIIEMLVLNNNTNLDSYHHIVSQLIYKVKDMKYSDTNKLIADLPKIVDDFCNTQPTQEKQKVKLETLLELLENQKKLAEPLENKKKSKIMRLTAEEENQLTNLNMNINELEKSIQKAHKKLKKILPNKM